jgi:hypothetical protein
VKLFSYCPKNRDFSDKDKQQILKCDEGHKRACSSRKASKKDTDQKMFMRSLIPQSKGSCYLFIDFRLWLQGAQKH